jgi:hypothetical protein
MALHHKQPEGSSQQIEGNDGATGAERFGSKGPHKAQTLTQKA